MKISPGVYRIRNVGTNTMLDLGRSEGFAIRGWAQNDQPNQHWFVILSGNEVVLKNVESGQYAYIPSASIRNGSKLFGSGNFTTWNLNQNGGEWKIFIPGTNYAVEMGGGNKANGGGVNLWEYVGHGHQKWAFEKISDEQPQQLQQQHLPQQDNPPQQHLEQNHQQAVPTVSPGIYHLRNVMSGTLISLHGGSTDEGAPISGYEYSGGNHQKWKLQPTGYGQNMAIRNVQTNTYLSFRSQSLVPSFSVKSSYQSQDFVITAANRGFYISPVQQSSYALSLLHGSGQDGTEIAIWHNDQQDNQKWHFEHA
ncbi:hypothetical protein RSAG8_13016, partial [Rhizoctonia solani AG-8 WAC10335]